MTIRSTSRFLLAVVALLSTPAWSQAKAPLTQVVDRVAPVETLASVPASGPRPAGSGVVFNATLSGVAPSGPTGTVQFTICSQGGAILQSGTATIVGGVASWTATPSPEAYSVSAAYPGDINYLPQTSTLAEGAAEDFAFTPPAVTIAQGATWTGNIQVQALNGFTGNISWTCTHVPSQIACNLPQPTTTFTTANESVIQNVPLSIPTSPGDFIPGASAMVFCCAFGSRKRFKVLLGVALSCIVLFGMTGCGSGGSAAWNLITPKATYQVLITGTSGIVTHSQQLTVVVH